MTSPAVSAIPPHATADILLLYVAIRVPKMNFLDDSNNSNTCCERISDGEEMNFVHAVRRDDLLDSLQP
jgi:hypothetical protein